ncbi:MAG TPA: hypothetical protein VF637_00430, partial [Sphingomicrobium sp.]
EVRARATAYWLASNLKAAAPDAVALKAEVKRLGRHVRTLVSAGLKFDGAERMADIRQFATGGDFESANRRKSAADSDRLSDLAGVLEDLLSDVDTAFYAEFHPQRSRGWTRWLPLSAFLLVRD